MADVHDQADCTITLFFWINVFFTIFFLGEATIKLIGLGLRWYFADSWNAFDFLVVMASTFTLVLDALAGDHYCNRDPPEQSGLVQQLSSLGILRAVRILRVLRLVRRHPGIRGKINTLVGSLSSLSSVAGLLILMMTIFAVLGVNLFHNVSPNQDIYGNVGDSTGFPSDNYRTLGNAMLMLLRQTTGEAWNY